MCAQCTPTNASTNLFKKVATLAELCLETASPRHQELTHKGKTLPHLSGSSELPRDARCGGRAARRSSTKSCRVPGNVAVTNMPVVNMELPPEPNRRRYADRSHLQYFAMALLRFKHGLTAGLCARSASLGRRRTAGSAPFSVIAGVGGGNVPLQPVEGTKPRERWGLGLSQQQQRHLSKTSSSTFDYKPLFQYGATPRDDPTEVSACLISRRSSARA